MNEFLYWILGLILAPIITAILEYKFAIIGRLKKVWFFTINKNVGFELNLTFNEIDDFEKIKKSFLDISRERNKKISIKKTNRDKLELMFDNYLITLFHMPNKELFIDTSRVECGMREIKKKLNLFLCLISKLEKNNNIKSKEISFNIFVPFKWSYVNIRTPPNLKLKDYDVKFTDEEFKSIINLKMNKISIGGDERALNYVIDNFIGLF